MSQLRCPGLRVSMSLVRADGVTTIPRTKKALNPARNTGRIMAFQGQSESLQLSAWGAMI